MWNILCSHSLPFILICSILRILGIFHFNIRWNLRKNCFSPIFHRLFQWWKWTKTRKKEMQRKAGKWIENRRRKWGKELERNENKQGKTWKQLTHPQRLETPPKSDLWGKRHPLRFILLNTAKPLFHNGLWALKIEEKRRKRNCVNRFWRPISTSGSVV